VAKVYETTDSTALVDLMIHNFNDIETAIALRFERNDWYIDEFTPESDDPSMASTLLSKKWITTRRPRR